MAKKPGPPPKALIQATENSRELAARFREEAEVLRAVANHIDEVARGYEKCVKGLDDLIARAEEEDEKDDENG